MAPNALRLAAAVAAVGVLARPPGAAAGDVPLHKLGDFATAKCLDGTPGAYYHRVAANATTATKWVFSLQGGGECTTEEDCLDRAASDLGSSTNYSADGARYLEQFQDASATKNPDFYDWHHVFVMYCTGDLHLGTVTDPGEEQWGWASFSGALVVDAVLADLQTRDDLGDANLTAATEVIWSGDSAGGIGSAASVDHVQAVLSESVRVVGAPIAGFYWNNSHPYTGVGALDYIAFDTGAWEQLYQLYQMRLPEACMAAHADMPWVCGLLNFSLPTAVADIFVMEMLVDSVQQSLHDGVPDYNNDTASYVVGFGRNMTQALIDQVVGGKAAGKTGLFAPACYAHTAFYSTRPLLGGDLSVNFLTAFADWMFDRGQVDDFLYDDCCSASDDFVDFNPTC